MKPQCAARCVSLAPMRLLGRAIAIDSGQLRAARALACFLLAATLPLASQSQGAAVSNPYNQTRTSAFTYYVASDGAKSGLLKTEVIEPDTPSLCVVTTYDYDALGNRTVASTANCAAASGRALFTARSSTTTFAAQTVTVAGVSVAIPAGTVATSANNPLSQGERRTYDPRFGAMLSLTGPNALSTNWTLDDFGRKVRETRADRTATVIFYCYLLGRVSDNTANSAHCPTPGASGVPDDAVMFVQTEQRDFNDIKSAAYSRVFMDRAGRAIRTMTEAFDGASQAGGTNRRIVQDTDYNAYGAQTVTTQPYFLDSSDSTAAGAGGYGMTRTDHDVLGRVVAIYTADSTGQAGSASFGSRGSRAVAKTSIAYAGLSTTTTNDAGQTRKEEKNVDGKLVRITDALGARLVHQHDAFGNLVKTKDALGNITTIAYDLRGRKVSLSDPDTGLWQYDYNALGELVWQQNAEQRAASPAQVTTMAYDLLGRLTRRVEPEYTSTWSYDTYIGGAACNKGIGKLCETSTSSGIGKKFVYDGVGRPSSTRTTVSGGPSLASAVAYDPDAGRVISQTYPSGVQVNYDYTTKGFLNTLTLATPATVNPLPATPGGSAGSGATLSTGSVLWRAQSYNAWGKPEQHSYGNGVVSKAVYDADTGRVTSLNAGKTTSTNVLDHDYAWNSLGQMVQRNDANGDGSSGAVSDTFSYDSIGRLHQYMVAAPAIPGLSRTVVLQHNALGMLLFKSDVGIYSYGSQATAGVRPHALQSVAGAVNASYTYDDNGNALTASAGAWRSIAYTSFNLPSSQTGVLGPTGGPKYTWAYDENHQRIKETRLAGGVTRTTWMLHPDNQGGLGFECDSPTSASCASVDTSQRHYLSAGGMSIGVLVRTGALPALSASQTVPAVLPNVTLVKVEYWHKDHLGSLIATTDHAGAVTARYAYDPFGKRRQASGVYDAAGNLIVDWTNNTNKGTDRGFTGHEHLDDVGLIHMNGRIFDPMIGRFLQGDPLIQAADNLQNFDRYAYCMNNPLTCTDPSGHSWLSRSWHKLWRNSSFRLVASIAVAIALGPAGGANYLFSVESIMGQAAIAGFASGGVATGTVKGAIQGSFSAAVFAGVGNYLAGVDVVGGTAHDVATSTLMQNGISNPLVGVSLHAVAGCVTSAASGGKCGPGALSAAVSKGLGVGDVTKSMNFVAGAAVSAVAGGTVSVLGGGKFANGAQTGAFSYLFNFLAHKTPVINPNGIGEDSAYSLAFASQAEADIKAGQDSLLGQIFGKTGNEFSKWLDRVFTWEEYRVDATCAISSAGGGGCTGTRDLPKDQRTNALQLDPAAGKAAQSFATSRGWDLGSLNRAQVIDVLNAVGAAVPKFQTTYGTGAQIIDRLPGPKQQ
jgi:RHS repeat-associated protein